MSSGTAIPQAADAAARADAPPPAGRRPRKWKGALAGWAIDAVLATAVTAVLIVWSAHHGRLLLPPQYDDVAYLAQAMRWVVLFEHGGLEAVAGRYAQEPAHSPLSDLTGALGFVLLGKHDWAPYATRGLVILVLLRVVRGLAPHLPPAARWVLAGGMICTPLTGRS
jgi:hypothetical protein